MNDKSDPIVNFEIVKTERLTREVTIYKTWHKGFDFEIDHEFLWWVTVYDPRQPAVAFGKIQKQYRQDALLVAQYSFEMLIEAVDYVVKFNPESVIPEHL